MSRAWAIAIAVGLLGSWASAQTSKAAGKDDGKKQNVSFETADYVRIAGTFYKSEKGNEAPAVILLHRFTSDRTAAGLDQLATALQTRLNCAVLTFDFRGHGGSKSVRDKFWNYESNKVGIRGGASARNKGEISFNEFKPNYWPMLLNDLAAARYYLDTENDAQRCNSSSIIVIGVQDSAGLAMGWVTHEWERMAIPASASTTSINPVGRIPGEDIAACVWLGPVNRGGSVVFRATDWFNRCSKLRENTPMYFLYGRQDSASASLVPGLYGAIKRAPEGVRSKHAYDKEEAIATSLRGQDLLSATALHVDDKIIRWLDDVLKKYRKDIAWKAMNPAKPMMFPLNSLNLLPPG